MESDKIESGGAVAGVASDKTGSGGAMAAVASDKTGSGGAVAAVASGVEGVAAGSAEDGKGDCAIIGEVEEQLAAVATSGRVLIESG